MISREWRSPQGDSRTNAGSTPAAIPTQLIKTYRYGRKKETHQDVSLQSG
jgi:hypothetical protein